MEQILSAPVDVEADDVFEGLPGSQGATSVADLDVTGDYPGPPDTVSASTTTTISAMVAAIPVFSALALPWWGVVITFSCGSRDAQEVAIAAVVSVEPSSMTTTSWAGVQAASEYRRRHTGRRCGHRNHAGTTSVRSSTAAPAH